MLRQPGGCVNGVSLEYYHPGRTYDMPAALAEYLVLEGYALLEMRRDQRSTRSRPKDRRSRDRRE